MLVFCKFSNGRQTGLDCATEEEAIGYVQGIAAAARCLEAQAWVASSLAGEAGIDNDSWRSAEAWLDAHISNTMNQSLREHLASVEEAMKALELACKRHELAERVMHEYQAALQRTREALEQAPADCDRARQRIQFALAPALQELTVVVQHELEALLDAERQMNRAREMLRQAESNIANKAGR